MDETRESKSIGKESFKKNPTPRKTNGSLKALNDHFSRVHPFTELILFLGLVLGYTWLVMPWAFIAGNLLLMAVGYVIYGIAFAWAFVINFIVRGTSLSELGYSNALVLKDHFQQYKRKQRGWFITFILMFAALAFTIIISDPFTFSSLIPVLSEVNLLFSTMLPIPIFTLLIMGEAGLVIVFVLFFLLRWDTLHESLKQYFKLGSPFIIIMIIIAILFFRDNVVSLGLLHALANLCGYVIWAFLQQALSLIYFGTLIRMGFERTGNPADKHKQQIYTAIITAIFFAVIHFPAWSLSLIAGVMEFILVYVYFNPKTRNIFAACLLHAICGVIIVYLLDLDLVSGFIAVIK